MMIAQAFDQSKSHPLARVYEIQSFKERTISTEQQQRSWYLYLGLSSDSYQDYQAM